MVVPMSRGIDAGLGDGGARRLDAEIDRRDLREAPRDSRRTAVRMPSMQLGVGEGGDERVCHRAFRSKHHARGRAAVRRRDPRPAAARVAITARWLIEPLSVISLASIEGGRVEEIGAGDVAGAAGRSAASASKRSWKRPDPDRQRQSQRDVGARPAARGRPRGRGRSARR